MAALQTRTVVSLGVVAVVILALAGYAGWRAYENSPVDEHGAEMVAIEATGVLIRAGSGDTSACKNMRHVSSPSTAAAVVERCKQGARGAVSNGPGWLGIRGLQPTKVDVGRHSGSVTVSGTVMTRGPAVPMGFTWPLKRVDGAWVLSGVPEVKLG